MINKSKQINIKVSVEELEEIQNKTDNLRFKSVSEYIRFVILNCEVKVKV